MNIRGEFIVYMKRVKNGSKIGFEDGVWYPHPSPEGGNDTIGYGHKLQNDQEWMQSGLDNDEVERLLIGDISKAAEGASRVISEFGSDDFDSLSQNCKEIFTDFVFNIGPNGLRKFPKFVNATLDDEKDVMHQEYKRYYRTGSGELRELEHRNLEFSKMFL